MKTSILRNQQGQFVIEGILLMVLMVALTIALTTKVRETGLVTRMVTGPWAKIAGMTENGVWEEPGPAARAAHPNSFDRVFTQDN